MDGEGKRRRVPRWAKWLMGVAVGLGILFYGAGGYVFSNMIHADALTPQPPTPDYGVYVRAVDGDSVTLFSEEERDDTLQPGSAGLSWEGGYGQLGAIAAVDGLEVTRGFLLVSGELPAICTGTVGACEPVDIEGVTYPTDPSDVGLEFEEGTYQSAVGPMSAWRVDAGDGTVWAVHAHGWRASRREALRSLPVYHRAGVTSLVIDYRNDPDAPRDPSGLYRFGLTEWEDVEGAVSYALGQGAERVVLVGYSTGASAEMAFMQRSDLAGRVSAVVFDAPNVDMGATVRTEAARRTIPGTPIPVPGSLTAVAMWLADLRWGVGWGEIDYTDGAGDYLVVPTLVFHGADDTRVPVDVSRRLQAAAPDQVELVVVEEAGHVASWNVDPGRYERILGGFLEEALGG